MSTWFLKCICAFNRVLGCLRRTGESGGSLGEVGAPGQLWILAGCATSPNWSWGGPNDLFYTNTGALS